MAPSNQQPFSQVEIERMRQLVLQHDTQNRPKEFDLNNPPKEQYSFQEYPKHKYHASGQVVIVNDRAQEDALGKEWGDVPPKSKPEWLRKANPDKATKHGFVVNDFHVAFLKGNGVDVSSVDEAIRFLDQLSEDGQVKFFDDFNNYVPTEESDEAPRRGRPRKAESVA